VYFGTAEMNCIASVPGTLNWDVDCRNWLLVRFVRDYMRYKDEIQCAGHTLVQAVRAEARAAVPGSNGEYYALHIRRGDFQFKVRSINQWVGL
jgi:hypothetical protein